MDPLITKFVEQVPSAGALVWCVIRLLQFIQAGIATNAERDEAWQKAMATLAEQYQTFHAEQRDRAHDALDRANAALLKNAAALALAERALSKVKE